MSEHDELADVRATAPEAEDTPPEREGERLPERRREAGGLAAAQQADPPHAARFALLTGVLGVVAIVTVTAAVVVAASGGRSGSDDRAAWSQFKPSSDGLDTGAREIADYVAPRYRLPSGRQIVAVTGGPLELQGVPMRIAVRHSPADGGEINLLNGGGVLYRLCGLGAKCAIATGKPTRERSLLLQREALELALYSFHDLKDVHNVVVFMPPRKGKSPEVALHFQRGDVAGQLVRPLRATLPPPVPTPDTIDRSPDTPFVERLTFGNIFKFSLTQGNQEAAIFLVLDPLPTGS